MKEYFNLLKKYKVILPLLLLVFFEAVKSTLSPYSTKVLTQAITSIGDNSELWKNFILFIVVYAVSIIFIRVRWAYSSKVRDNFAEKYRNDLFHKVIHFSIKDLQVFNIPSLTVAVQSTYDVANDAVSLPLFIIGSLSTFVTSFVIMANTNLTLTLILLVICFPLILLFFYLRKVLKLLISERKEASTLLNMSVSRIEGYLTIKSFAKEEFEMDNYKKVSNLYKKASIKKRMANQNASFSITILNACIDIFIILYAVFNYDDPTIAITNSMIFYNLAGNLFAPFAQLPDITDSISNLSVHISDNSKILNTESEYNGTLELESFNDSIEFKDVSFSYDNSSNTLKNVNLSIPKGTKVGIYGPSGAGKSTFINLINRFFKVNSGEILIDGININEFTNSSLRRIIGNVNQEIFMFSEMTIKENIKYGIDCSDEELEEAAKLANAHEFIIKLSNGYNSKVGNNGIMLSGGEKQRIALARLFLLNPPILILDEATSKLDNVSELLIKESIDRLSKDKTVISIAHRFTTIENSDLLVGIKGHTIYEKGDRNYIKNNGKLYSSLNI